MHPGYTVLWTFMLAAILGLELASSLLKVPDVAWALVLAPFLVLEGIAVARKGAGDTFSELMWAFQAGGWSRKILVSALTLYMGLRVYMIGSLPEPSPAIPRAILATGLVGWLLVHFARFGRDG